MYNADNKYERNFALYLPQEKHEIGNRRWPEAHHPVQKKSLAVFQHVFSLPSDPLHKKSIPLGEQQ